MGAYDPTFSQPIWHIDAENRASACCYDSNQITSRVEPEV